MIFDRAWSRLTALTVPASLHDELAAEAAVAPPAAAARPPAAAIKQPAPARPTVAVAEIGRAHV